VKAVWAVCVHLLTDIRRNRGFPFYLGILCLCAWFAPRSAAELDLLPRLRLLVQYGLALPVVIIGIATLVIASGSLGREIEGRQIHLVVSRPIRRSQILLGKLLGILILDVVLLGVVASICVGQIVWASSSAEEGARSVVESRFFTIRRPVAVDEFENRALGSGESLTISFSNLDTTSGTDETLVLRGRQDAIPRGSILEVECDWSSPAAPAGTAPIRTKARVGSVFEVEVPSSWAEGGRLVLVATNAHEELSNIRLVTSPVGLELYAAYGSFVTTLIVALALLLVQFVFLGTIGLLGAALFSLPTAALVASFVYVTGLVSPFLSDSLDAFRSEMSSPRDDNSSRGHSSGARSHARHDHGHDHDDAWVDTFVDTLGGVLAVLPNFRRDDPLTHVVESRSFSIGDVSWRFGGSLLLRAAFVFGVTCFFWRRREIGSA